MDHGLYQQIRMDNGHEQMALSGGKEDDTASSLCSLLRGGGRHAGCRPPARTVRWGAPKSPSRCSIDNKADPAPALKTDGGLLVGMPDPLVQLQAVLPATEVFGIDMSHPHSLTARGQE